MISLLFLGAFSVPVKKWMQLRAGPPRHRKNHNFAVNMETSEDYKNSKILDESTSPDFSTFVCKTGGRMDAF